MPIEFIQQPQPTGSSSDTLFRLLMKYGSMGFRVEALDPDTNTPTVEDDTGKKRTYIQLHKRGASHGCGMMDQSNYEKFKDAVEMMKAENLSNGYENGIDMLFESFESAGN